MWIRGVNLAHQVGRVTVVLALKGSTVDTCSGGQKLQASDGLPARQEVSAGNTSSPQDERVMVCCCGGCSLCNGTQLQGS